MKIAIIAESQQHADSAMDLIKQLEKIGCKELDKILFVTEDDKLAREAFRMLERQAAISFGSPGPGPRGLSATIFGKPSLSVGDTVIRWQTAKTAELFMYLLFYNLFS
jgi:hypothetical protein